MSNRSCRMIYGSSKLVHINDEYNLNTVTITEVSTQRFRKNARNFAETNNIFQKYLFLLLTPTAPSKKR
jgi:hypothetical protein